MRVQGLPGGAERMSVLFMVLLLTTGRPPAPAAVPIPSPVVTAAPAPRAYLPALVNVPAWLAATRVPTARPTPPPSPLPVTPRPVRRPATEGELKKALQEPGALVRPACGEYRPCCPLRMSAGGILDGGGCVTIRGEGLILYEAHGATVRNLRIVDADGDGISVNRSAGILVERVTIDGWGDGGLDIVRTPDGSPVQVVRDVILRGGTKGMLLGHQWEPVDDGARVLLERVTFEVDVRQPKVHRARVTIRGGVVRGWRGPRLDVQLGGHVDANGTRWEAGPDSENTLYLPTGGTVTEEGMVFVPFRRQQPIPEALGGRGQRRAGWA